MFVEVFRKIRRYSFTPYNEQEMESVGLINENLILTITPYPEYFGSDMKYIEGNWYSVEIDNSKKVFYGSNYIKEEDYIKLGGKRK